MQFRSRLAYGEFGLCPGWSGQPVLRRAAVRPGQRLTNEFADGRVPVRAE